MHMARQQSSAAGPLAVEILFPDAGAPQCSRLQVEQAADGFQAPDEPRERELNM